MSNIHALVIDDDTKNLRVLAQLLARQGVSTTEVSDPATLGAVLSTLPAVDLIFLDLEMPAANGYAVKDWLREQMPNVWIIACTVHVSEINVVQQLGFDGFIGKPLDMARFPEQIGRIMRGEAVWDRT